MTLSACGSSGGDVAADEKQTLTVWAMGAEGEKLADVAEVYEKANPNITVKVTPIGWDVAHQKLVSAAAAGTLPDVAQMGGTYMGEFSELGVLEPVDTEVFDKKDFFPAGWEQGEVDGTAYGVPWYVDTRVLYYRTDLAEKAGVTEAPTDWKGLKGLATAYQEKAGTKWGLSIQPSGLDTVQNFSSFLYSAERRDRQRQGRGRRRQPGGGQGAEGVRLVLRQGPLQQVRAARLRRGEGLRQRPGPDVLRRPLARDAPQRGPAADQGQVGHSERSGGRLLHLHGRMVPPSSSPRTASTRPRPPSSSST